MRSLLDEEPSQCLDRKSPLFPFRWPGEPWNPYLMSATSTTLTKLVADLLGVIARKALNTKLRYWELSQRVQTRNDLRPVSFKTASTRNKSSDRLKKIIPTFGISVIGTRTTSMA